jgi:hypothetical protein
MRRASSILGVVTLLTAPAAQRLSAQERILPLARDGYFRVYNRSGSIHVTGWDVDSVRWRVRLSPGQELFGGGNAQMAKVGVSGADGPTTFEVQVPRGVKLVIDAGEGSVDIEGVAGAIEIQGGAGAVRVTGAPARLTIETVDGAVTLAGGVFRSTEVRTAGGMIQVEGARGEIVLSSVTGAVIAEVDSVTRGAVSTVSGVIRLGAGMDHTGTLTVESHGGDIQLRLDPRPGVELMATAFGGPIENTLTHTLPHPVRDGRSQLLETNIGSGGGTVTVTSFKGRIRLQAR